MGACVSSVLQVLLYKYRIVVPCSINRATMNLTDMFSKKAKVLVVEDDVRLRGALREEFELRNYRVLEAGDSREVLSLVAAEKPDAMVLDLILPLKDGISLLEELRATGYEAPVVILSNLLGSDSLRSDADRLDAVFYNKTATSLTEIVDAVGQQLSH